MNNLIKKISFFKLNLFKFLRKPFFKNVESIDKLFLKSILDFLSHAHWPLSIKLSVCSITRWVGICICCDV